MRLGKATGNIGPTVGGPTPGRSRCEANVRSRTPSVVKARTARVSSLLVRSPIEPPKRMSTALLGDYQAAEVEIPRREAVWTGSLPDNRNAFGRDIVNEFAGAVVHRRSRIRCPGAGDAAVTACAVPPHHGGGSQRP